MVHWYPMLPTIEKTNNFIYFIYLPHEVKSAVNTKYRQ